MGDWSFYGTFLDRIRKVTTDDVRRVAQVYLTRKKSTTGWFVPQPEGQIGATTNLQSGAYSRHDGPGPEYYRAPDISDREDVGGPLNQFWGKGSSDTSSSYAKRIAKSEVNGIEVFSLKTGFQDVITIRGSLPAGNAFNPEDNFVLAGLVAEMLDKGTVSRGKFEIAEKLEEVGASISFSSETFTTGFSATCLKKDLQLILELLAEQLREPAFNAEELAKLKIQQVGALQRAKENVEYRSEVRMRQLLFPQDHPNFVADLDVQMRDIEKTTVQDLAAFHQTVYGSEGMIIVGVGDVDAALFRETVEAVFKGWGGGVQIHPNPVTPTLNAGVVELVEMADKPSLDVRWGIATGLKRTDPDYLPLSLGTSILGGSFSARLMSTVRDNEGLTYGIHAYTDGDRLTDGFW
jgi:zinc protease